MIYRFFTFIIVGALGSKSLYRATHGEGALLPETAGMVAGGLLVMAAFYAMCPRRYRDEAIVVLAAAFAAVGIGVGVNRIWMTLQ